VSSTGAALLDVNVLVALAWPNQVGHSAARAWFQAESAHGWATSPVTESGFVRVSSNRRAMPTASTPGLAIDLLRRLRHRPGHTFWPDSVQDVVADHIDPALLGGYRQVTDAHLLALCLANRGTLVTFDRAVTSLLPDESDRILLLQAGE
jgi:toxin-antitoxin system PIN domain toxin